jgi:hypothetical protein
MIKTTLLGCAAGWRGLLRRCLAAPLVAGCLLVGCERAKQGGAKVDTVVISTRTAYPRVENGWAYHKATLPLVVAQGVVVPHDATLHRGGPPGRVEIFMEKAYFFMGHPGSPHSIRDDRKSMGCTCKTEGDKLVIGTYGEWAFLEGDAAIRLVIRVPGDLKVESRRGLSGPLRNDDDEEHPTRLIREDCRPGSTGWMAIPDEPDPTYTAKSVQWQ